MLDKLTQEDFSQHLNESFHIHIEGAEPIECELVDVKEFGSSRPESGARAPFSITFRGPKEIQLYQSIWKLENSGMGSFEIFLVPIGPDDEGMLYEAVFA